MEFSTAILWYLLGLTVRSLCLAGVAWSGLTILRVQTAAARHAVWAATMVGMLLLAVLSPATPRLPLRVLGPPGSVEAPKLAPAAAVAVPPVGTAGVSLMPPVVPERTVRWQQVVACLYASGVLVFLFRLLLGWVYTARLVGGSRAAGKVLPDGVLESDRISVPLTVGWMRPRILLPAGWRNWEDSKLRAVLVHERSHVGRGDWAVALLARVNRCVFWFHPLAWWLERQLSTLAEEACDDAAVLALGERENYALVLLEMASAVRAREGRLVREAMAMAKVSGVRTRIERILDESRQIPMAVSRRGWAMLVACGTPLLYLASSVHLTPALAQTLPHGQRPDFAQMERYLAAHPEDLAARHQLIRDYFLYSIRQPRLNHIFWMIQSHPESDLTALDSTGISRETTELNDEEDYRTAARLWRFQAAAFAATAQVQANAARFFAQSESNWHEAEQLLQSARSLDPKNAVYTQQLARLYATAISGPPDLVFGAKARETLARSTDAALVASTATALRGTEFGAQLAEQAQELLLP